MEAILIQTRLDVCIGIGLVVTSGLCKLHSHFSKGDMFTSA